MPVRSTLLPKNGILSRQIPQATRSELAAIHLRPALYPDAYYLAGAAVPSMATRTKGARAGDLLG